MAAPESSAPRPTPEAEEIYRRWIQFLDDEFVRHSSPERRGEIVRDQLYQLYLGRPFSGKLNLKLTSELPGNVVSLSLDPQNVTLEQEHFAEVDRERFARRKPLLWFWQMFDRSPIGLNHWLGLRFRCMLGRHIFEHLGSGVKIYHGVDLTYGYNLSIGDGVTIRQRALLNDRGGITIGNNAVIGSFSRDLLFLARSAGIQQGPVAAYDNWRRRSHRHPCHRPRGAKRRTRRICRHLPRRSRLMRAPRSRAVH